MKDKISYIQNWNYFLMQKINSTKLEHVIQSADIVKNEHLIYSYD